MRADGRTERIGRTLAHRLRNRTAGVCVLGCLVLIAVCVWPGLRVGSAQSASTMSEAASKAAQAEANQAQSDAAGEKKASAANAQAPAPGPAAKQEAAAALTDPRQKQIAEESADLLKLASSLKAEVDKTTVDTLSVAVIRHAGEIEKLAHKMRSR